MRNRKALLAGAVAATAITTQLVTATTATARTPDEGATATAPCPADSLCLWQYVDRGGDGYRFGRAHGMDVDYTDNKFANGHTINNWTSSAENTSTTHWVIVHNNPNCVTGDGPAKRLGRGVYIRALSDYGLWHRISSHCWVKP